MHAVFVLPRFYPYRGGYENSMLAIARCLVGRGHRVTVFTTTADDLESLWVPGHKTFPSEQFVIDGVTVRRFPVCHKRWRRRATRFAGLLPNWRLKAQFWTPAFRVPGLSEALRDVDADVIHIGPLPYNNLMYAGVQAALRRCLPVIATPCAHFGQADHDATTWRNLPSHQIAVLRHCDRVFCMTDIERGHFEQMGITAPKLETIGHGFDLQLATGGNGERIRQLHNVDGPVVLHLGAKAFEKGSITLVEAMERLWAQGSKAWLVMAGPALSSFDKYLATQERAMTKMVNLPAFPDEDKRDLLAAATLVAQPSRVESLGLVLLEAWASAKPVVAADIDVSRKLVESSGGGVVVPFGDSRKLALEIEKLLADEGLRRRMGLCGQETALAYDGSILWPRYAEAFEQVLADYRRSRR